MYNKAQEGSHISGASRRHGTHFIEATSSRQHPLDEPPPLIHQQSPYATIQLPAQIETTNYCLNIHGHLRYASPQLIQYDLRTQPPILPYTGTAMSYTLYEPATEPSLPSLTLNIPGLPWPIIAHGSEGLGGRKVVTVVDVWIALDRDLRLPAAENALWDGLMTSEAQLPEWVPNDSGAHGYSGRRSRSRSSLRRLEYLGLRTMFAGLSKLPGSVDTLTVHVC